MENFTMSDPISLRDYWDSLNRHDWYYDYSDDHGVWKRGSSERSRLRALSMQSREHRDMFDKFHAHYFSGEGFGTSKQPKPERPE